MKLFQQFTLGTYLHIIAVLIGPAFYVKASQVFGIGKTTQKLIGSSINYYLLNYAYGFFFSNISLATYTLDHKDRKLHNNSMSVKKLNMFRNLTISIYRENHRLNSIR